MSEPEARLKPRVAQTKSSGFVTEQTVSAPKPHRYLTLDAFCQYNNTNGCRAHVSVEYRTAKIFQKYELGFIAEPKVPLLLTATRSS